MADFSQFLRKPAGEAKKPPVLPIMDAPGIIKSFEFGDKNRNQTPYVRFHLALTDWGATAPETWTVSDPNGKSYEVSRADVDLSKRQQRRDFFLTDDALWRLDEFLKSCGLEAEGKTYEELIPAAVGANVLVEIQQYLNQNTNEIGNQVGKVVGVR